MHLVLLLKEVNVKFQNVTYRSVNIATSLWLYNKTFEYSDEMSAFSENYRKHILAEKWSSLKMGLHSFRTEKHDKMIFFTDNEEDIFDLMFLANVLR